jgi:hypothetical protein
MRLLALVGILAIVCAGELRADAIVRTQAMFATTIAEYFVEPDRVRLELEIGIGDIPAFRNLLPDELYEKLGHEPRPLAERFEEFWQRNLVIYTDDSQPLAARIVEMGPRQRIRRDEISGEPLPAVEGQEEVVVRAVLEYPFEGRPETITFLGTVTEPRPNVGFVAYHGNIAVNDFRYLSPSQTLLLDWGDPWYSRFEARPLRRTYFAPMSGFIYVENYEVRKEIIARPIDLQQWVDLGLEGRETIPVEIQSELLRTAAEFLRGRHVVVIDGLTVEPELARINFLERSLRSSRVIEPARELDVYSAILGAIFVYPTQDLPEKVTMDWDLFSERIRVVPAASVDQAGPLPVFLEPDVPVLEWQNFLKNPVIPTMIEIREPPGAAARSLGMLRWILLPGCVVLAIWLLMQPRRGTSKPAVAFSAAAIVLVIGFMIFRAGGFASVSDDRASDVVGGLLHNIYRAFDYRQDEQIYDTLNRSVAGDLLERIYLETRRGLELANQGGARAKVKDVRLTELVARPTEDGAFVADATWEVHGSVGHWGHVHTRSNRYRADLTISPADGQWKLIGLEIIDEERLTP